MRELFCLCGALDCPRCFPLTAHKSYSDPPEDVLEGDPDFDAFVESQRDGWMASADSLPDPDGDDPEGTALPWERAWEPELHASEPCFLRRAS